MVDPLLYKLASLLFNMEKRSVLEAHTALGHRTVPHEKGCECDDCLGLRHHLSLYEGEFGELPLPRQQYYAAKVNDVLDLLVPHFTHVHQEAVSGSLKEAQKLAEPLRMKLDPAKLLELQAAWDAHLKQGPGRIIIEPVPRNRAYAERGSEAAESLHRSGWTMSHLQDDISVFVW